METPLINLYETGGPIPWHPMARATAGHRPASGSAYLNESPMFLALKGRTNEARHVVEGMGRQDPVVLTEPRSHGCGYALGSIPGFSHPANIRVCVL